jgi:hypothetical protein
MRALVVLGSSLVALVLAASTGCRNGGSDDSSGGSGGSGGSTSKGTGTATGGAGGQAAMCDGEAHTVQEVTTGTVGKGTHVTLSGVVVMSRKFLASSSTHCLWGVFVSAPGLTETGPNTGVMVLAYGTDPVVPSGGTKAYCPKLGMEPTGDSIPDDIKPGDVIELTGTTDYFPTMPKCDPAMGNPLNMVPMRQISATCKVTKTGTAPLPKIHVLTASEIASVSSTTDTAFHDQWGGVKVAVENSGVVPTMDSPPAVIDSHGNYVLTSGNISVGDKLFYKAWDTSTVCSAGPTYVDTKTVFTHVEGFHYLNFCTWSIQPNDKCADVVPPSPDCLPKNGPPITSCP